MFVLRNSSDTAVIVLHEIYGINKHIKSKCIKLHDYGFDIYCPNLLNCDEPYEYANEKQAYCNFMQNIGIEESVKRIEVMLKELRDKYKYLFVVGYSVGATISWLCSEFEKYCDGVICFYGSRIRDYVSIEPKCPVASYFAATEKSFDVDKLIDRLKVKENVVEVRKYNGEHGFADEFSKKFNLESYQKSYNAMITFIEDKINNT